MVQDKSRDVLNVAPDVDYELGALDGVGEGSKTEIHECGKGNLYSFEAKDSKRSRD